MKDRFGYTQSLSRPNLIYVIFISRVRFSSSRMFLAAAPSRRGAAEGCGSFCHADWPLPVSQPSQPSPAQPASPFCGAICGAICGPTFAVPCFCPASPASPAFKLLPR